MTDVEDFFSDSARWQSWLDVEAELALAQAEIGMIPDWAGPAIAEAARLDRLDQDLLRTEIARTMAPVAALARVLGDAAGDAGAYVHWGATTQNVVETGRLLVLRRFNSALEGGMANVLDRLSAMAQDHAQTVAVGRTNRQHALPITFGFKVAAWIEDLLQVTQRLEETKARAFQLRFGGAIGAYQSFGPDGPRLAASLGRRLGLAPALVPGRTGLTAMTEYLATLAALGQVAARIADELYLLMQEEIGELHEALGDGVIGSSTMPHKTNPKLVVNLRANANLLRGRGAAALSLPPPSHEGDAATNRELRLLIEESCPLALKVLTDLGHVLGAIVVDPARLRENVMMRHEFLAMEPVMMRLAPQIGRQAAHDRLHKMVDRARKDGTSLRRIMETDPVILAHLDADALDALLDPAQNTGESGAIALQAAAAAIAQADLLRAGASAHATRWAAPSVRQAAQVRVPDRPPLGEG